MTILTINLPDSSSAVIKDISSLVKNAGGDIFVSNDKESKKEELKAEFKQALAQVTDIIEGKAPRKSLKDILNG